MVSDSGSASDFQFTDLNSADLDLIAKSGLIALVNLNHNRQGANLAKDLFSWVKENTTAITFMDIGDPSNNSKLITPLLENAICSGNLDVLGLNENEVGWLAWSLTGKEKWLELAKHPEDWINGASLIAQETGVKIVLHTQHFSSIIDDEVISVLAFQVEPRVSCGSGDVFNAGLIFGILAGLQPMDQLILANATAALYISSASAIPPRREDVIHYLKSKPVQSHNGNKLLM
jgi:sugar/nucleoside kinase (ribokinase family)